LIQASGMNPADLTSDVGDEFITLRLLSTSANTTAAARLWPLLMYDSSVNRSSMHVIRADGGRR
jgi:hypothetical protein